jgi:hypothetical protein
MRRPEPSEDRGDGSAGDELHSAEAGAMRRPEPSENSEPTGILNPGSIDSVIVGGDGVVELHIEQTAPWDGSDHLLLLTQEKFWNYLAYVADGDFALDYPQAAREAPATSRSRRRQERSDARSRATNWRVVFDARDEPDQRTADLLRQVAEEFRRLGGTMLTRRMPADR